MMGPVQIDLNLPLRANLGNGRPLRFVKNFLKISNLGKEKSMPLQPRSLQTRRLPEPLRAAYGSMREYKQEKRAELDAVLKELDTLRCGCVYLPPEAYAALCAAHRTLEDVRQQLSVKEWGR